MSTRALYTFKGEDASDTWNVYKHHDGYPSGAAETLQDTLDWFAWVTPRYEADEFACAFVAAGKAYNMIKVVRATNAKNRKAAMRFMPSGECPIKGGGVRLMPQGDPREVACSNCSDIEYRYEVYQGNDGELRIQAYSVEAWEAENYSEELIVDCKLVEFAAWANREEGVAA